MEYLLLIEDVRSLFVWFVYGWANSDADLTGMELRVHKITDLKLQCSLEPQLVWYRCGSNPFLYLQDLFSYSCGGQPQPCPMVRGTTFQNVQNMFRKFQIPKRTCPDTTLTVQC
jgi:hypothetical protein